MENPIQDFITTSKRSEPCQGSCVPCGNQDGMLPILIEAHAYSSEKSASFGDAALSDRQLNVVVGYVLRNMDGPLRVHELAAQVGLSASHFSRAFSMRLGKSPYVFVMEQRMLHARSLMLSTGQRLSEIAGNCGFADQAHLTRMFRRFEGTTPARWRRFRRPEPTAAYPDRPNSKPADYR